MSWEASEWHRRLLQQQLACVHVGKQNTWLGLAYRAFNSTAVHVCTLIYIFNVYNIFNRVACLEKSQKALNVEPTVDQTKWESIKKSTFDFTTQTFTCLLLVVMSGENVYVTHTIPFPGRKLTVLKVSFSVFDCNHVCHLHCNVGDCCIF